LTPRDPDEDNTTMAVTRISRDDLKARLDGDEAGRPALVDVRLKYAWDHSTVKLPAAVRLDPKHLQTTALDARRDVVVYCSDPNDITSVRVAAELGRAGFTAAVLTGGLPEWIGANLPIETKDAVRAATPEPAPAPAAKA
jgi:rhodanese-related sulfurtransferase